MFWFLSLSRFVVVDFRKQQTLGVLNLSVEDQQQI